MSRICDNRKSQCLGTMLVMLKIKQKEDLMLTYKRKDFGYLMKKDSLLLNFNKRMRVIDKKGIRKVLMN